MRTDKKKFSTRLMTALMAGTLAVGMLGMTAFAGEANQTETVTLTKKITKRADVYSPAATFTFTITSGTAMEATDTTDEIKAGPVGGVTFKDGANSTTMTSTPVLSDGQSTTVIEVGSEDLEIHPNSFKDGSNWKPGIYRYNIKESEGTYEGITYDTKVRYFDVYVTTGGIVSKSFVKVSDTKAKDDGVITNDYDKDHNKKEINDLTIEKKLAGDMADDSDEFEFTVTITGATGEKYNVIYSDGTTTGTITSGTPGIIKLKGGQSARITGLSHSDSYTVNEADYTSKGYKVSYDGKQSGTISVDTTTKVTNTKNAVSPTGIVLNYGPYILMIALAGSMAVFFLRKKNRKEA